MDKVRKKAQEEIVGFVIIVVLVAVITIIFLGISLRNGNNQKSLESEQIASFLSAVGEVTTNCTIPENSPKTISQLIVRCSDGDICSDEISSCKVLEENLKGMLDSSYLVGQDSFVRYYNLSAYYYSDKKPLINPLVNGNLDSCANGRKLVNNRPFTSTGISSNNEQIIMELEVCYND